MPRGDITFSKLKEDLLQPPILVWTNEGEPFYVYLSISQEVVGAVMFRKNGSSQDQIYFVRKTLEGLEI